MARTVVLKLKTSEFTILTRKPYSSRLATLLLRGLIQIVLMLCERVDLGMQQRYRLVGVGLRNFREPEDAAQPVLFE